MSNTPKYKRSAGFALVASLLILLVLLVLGISAISTVGLQEKMAGNLREKTRATEAAGMATRDAEERVLSLTDRALPGLNVAILDAGRDFLDQTLWNDADIGDPEKVRPYNQAPFDGSNPDIIGTGMTSENIARYFAIPNSLTEHWKAVGNNLDPDSNPSGNGIDFYRMTGQGFGGHQNAESILQSMYMKRPP